MVTNQEKKKIKSSTKKNFNGQPNRFIWKYWEGTLRHLFATISIALQHTSIIINADNDYAKKEVNCEKKLQKK